MIIHFDGGLRKNLIAIVVDKEFVKIEKRRYDNGDYEWDALEMALDYAIERLEENEPLKVIGDNNQVIRWIRGERHSSASIVQKSCLKKIVQISFDHEFNAEWVKRHRNLAGRALEYWTRRSSKPTEFIATWYECNMDYCRYIGLSEKEKQEHYYNEHVTIG